MPTRTQTPRRRANTTSSRFTRPLSVQRPAPRGKKQQDGLSGLMATAMSSLPVGTSQKTGRGRKHRAGGGGKGKPAMALLAAAGAVLGRRQMQKRRAANVPAPPAA